MCVVATAGCATTSPLPKTAEFAGGYGIDADRYDWVGANAVFAYQFPGARKSGGHWETGGGDAVPTTIAGGKREPLKVRRLRLEGHYHDVPAPTKDGRKILWHVVDRQEPMQIVGEPRTGRVLLLLSGLLKPDGHSTRMSVVDAAAMTARRPEMWAVLDRSGKLIRTWTTAFGEIGDLDKRAAWRPDGAEFGTLYRYGDGLKLHVRELATGREHDIPVDSGEFDLQQSWFLGWTAKDRILVRHEDSNGVYLTPYLLQGGRFQPQIGTKLPKRIHFYEPTLSPDGKWVLYRGEGECLQVMQVSNGEARTVYGTWPARGSYRWRPDGKAISFVEERCLRILPVQQ